MAAGTWQIYNKRRFLDGTFDFDSHTFRYVPLNSTASFDYADTKLSDVVSAEVTGDGGASLRGNLANVVLTDVAGPGVRLTADPFTITTTQTVAIKHVVIYDDTVADDLLVAICDMETGDSDGVDVTQLAVQFPSGIYTFS